MAHYKEFETKRLFIKPTVEEDASLVYELMNTPKFIKYVGDRNINSLQDAAQYIRDKMLPSLKKNGYSSYTLIRKSDNAKLGTCGLYDREGLEGIDIGFGLLPDYEGQGFAFESANRLKEAAFEEFGIKTLNAITSKKNISSQKLIEKLGLVLAGTTTLPNETEEILLYKAFKY